MTELLADAFARPVDVCRSVLNGIDSDDLNAHVRPGANSIAWLIWHIAREQDLQIADLADTEQVWISGGWYKQFGLDKSEFGLGHTAEQAAGVRVDDPGLLEDYLNAVADFVQNYLATMSSDSLDDVIDAQWDPPVTRGVRLVSIVDDAAQHAGQAAYVRGLLGWDAWRP